MPTYRQPGRQAGRRSTDIHTCAISARARRKEGRGARRRVVVVAYFTQPTAAVKQALTRGCGELVADVMFVQRR